ncbi:glutathione S-transferase family protein [soil metagenome]
MKLFYSGTSPFARKVMIVAHEANLASRIELVPVAAPTLPTSTYPELAKSNPLAKIPALVLDDGSSLFDSRVICEYLDTLHDGPTLVPEGADRFRVLRLQALADGVVDAGILIRFEQVLRPAALRWDEWVDGQARKVVGALDELEATTFPAALDLGQVAVGCALDWLELRKPIADIRSGRPRLFAWLDAIKQRPSFLATAPK